MNKKLYQTITLFTCFIVILVTLSGCVEEQHKNNESKQLLNPEIKLDQPPILPDWKDGEYHDYYITTQMLNDFNEEYPDLVNLFSIGKSVLGKELCCIRITNENNKEEKLSCLIDGCIHGHEWEGGEACLYLAEYLLINYGNNKTIANIINNSEIYIVPLVNPDGRQNDEMWLANDNSVDLNRNFDIFFGKLRAHNLRLGKLFGRFKIPFIKFPPNQPTKWWRNCGRYPFSEPESQALRDLIVLKPPFEMEKKEKDVFNYVLNWVEENTEYEAYREGPGTAGGIAMDWCFQEFRIPSFVFEVLSLDYECFRTGKVRHDYLVHWMKTTLPFFMYLLVNIDNLHDWRTPDIQPSLPEGVPPEPLK